MHLASNDASRFTGALALSSPIARRPRLTQLPHDPTRPARAYQSLRVARHAPTREVMRRMVLHKKNKTRWTRWTPGACATALTAVTRPASLVMRVLNSRSQSVFRKPVCEFSIDSGSTHSQDLSVITTRRDLGDQARRLCRSHSANPGLAARAWRRQRCCWSGHGRGGRRLLRRFRTTC